MTILRNADHSRWLGDGMWEMYKMGQLVDVTVHYHGKSADVHRLVLAVSSPVLRPSLVLSAIGGAGDTSTSTDNSRDQNTINLDDVIDRQLDLDILLEFMYRGEVVLSDRTHLPSLLRTAEALQFGRLVEAIGKACSSPRGRQRKMELTNHIEQITVTVDHPLLMSSPAASTRSATAAAAATKSDHTANHEQPDGEKDEDDTAPSFWCPHCCELFTSRPIYEQHMSALHPTEPGDEPLSASAARLRKRRRGRPRLEGPATRAKSKRGRKKAKTEEDASNEDCDSTSAADDPGQQLGCPLCDFWTAHSWRLTKHLAAIHKVYEKGVPQATEQCPECEYRCATGALLRRHIKCKHSTDRPYKCTECEFSAAIRSDLDRHKTTKHCTERRYTCSICGYGSKTKNAHDRHQKTHAKTPLLCKTCGLRYTSDGYRRHVKSHVVTDADGTNSSTVIKCHLCDQLMPITDLTEAIMRLHLLDLHALDVDKKNAQIERCNKARMKLAVTLPPP